MHDCFAGESIFTTNKTTVAQKILKSPVKKLNKTKKKLKLFLKIKHTLMQTLKERKEKNIFVLLLLAV